MLRSAMLVMLAVWAAEAHGSTFLDRPYGTPELGVSARSRALGGAAAALDQGVFGLVDNPATLVRARGSSLQLVGTFGRVSENRFVPLFDTFDSFVDEAAIAVNQHSYTSVHGGFVSDLRGRVPGVVLGAGVFDRYDPRYDYADERRTTATSDEIVSERFIRTRGVLRSFAMGAAAALPARAAVGVAVHRHFGTLTDRDALVPRAAGVRGRVTRSEREWSGTSAVLGGTIDVNDRVRLGLSWENDVRLDDEYAAWEDDSLLARAGGHVRLPWRLQTGLAYRPRNTFRTTFAFDAVYVPWSHLSDDRSPGIELEDVWDLRFGLEHIYYNDLPARIGFRYARSYAQREADVAAVTFGIGYGAAPFGLELSGEVGKRNSRQTPLWPREEQGPAVGAGMDRVEDTIVRIYLGTHANF